MKALLAMLAVAVVLGPARADDVRQEVVWNAAHNRIVPQMDQWFEDGDFPRCIQLLKIMHELDPGDYGTTTDLGWMLGNIEEPDQELAVYKSYRLAYPNDPEAAYPEGEFYFRKKQFEKVPPIIAPTIVKKPHPNSYRILAHSYDRLGKLVEARDIWVKLIADYPNEPAIKTTQMQLRQVEAKLDKAGAGK